MKKQRRLGTLTFGILLLAFGILLCISMFTNIISIMDIIKFWPVTLIIFGIEVVIACFNKETEIKYDIWGVIVTIFILTTTAVAGTADYFVNKVILSDQFKGYVENQIQNEHTKYRFYDKDLSVNISGKVVKTIKIHEDKNLDEIKVYMDTKIKNNSYVNKSKVYNLVRADIEANIFTFSSGYEEKYIESVELNIYTNNKEKIKITGDNIEIIK